MLLYKVDVSQTYRTAVGQDMIHYEVQVRGPKVLCVSVLTVFSYKKYEQLGFLRRGEMPQLFCHLFHILLSPP
jgi:hypothetical protein